MSPDKQRVIDPRPAPGVAAPRATAVDRRETRDDVARSEATRKARDGAGEKAQRGFTRRIDCAVSDSVPKQAGRRGGRASAAKQRTHDPDGRVH